MRTSGDHDLPSWDAEGGGDPEEDPAVELEATIEHADRPFAAESFGTTAEEEEEGEDAFSLELAAIPLSPAVQTRE